MSYEPIIYPRASSRYMQEMCIRRKTLDALTQMAEQLGVCRPAASHGRAPVPSAGALLDAIAEGDAVVVLVRSKTHTQVAGRKNVAWIHDALARGLGLSGVPEPGLPSQHGVKGCPED